MKGLTNIVTGERVMNWVARKRAQQWVNRGENFFSQGAFEKAFVCSKKALSICDLKSAYSLMHHALFPGDDYMSILSEFHDRLDLESYVEIGVQTGKSLALAKKDTQVIGIDPEPRISKTIKSRAKIYPMPSDDFFESYDLFKELGTTKLDLAFIDGLHHFDQALRDFINLERYANKETIILIHDCIPITRRVGSRERLTPFWTGDVWKIIPCLKKYRPDLNVHVVLTDPSGLGIVTNFDQTSTVLLDEINNIETEFHNLDLGYEYFQSNENRNVTMVPNHWQSIAEILPPSVLMSKSIQKGIDGNSGSSRGR
jgi:hypothetical protein